MSVDLTTQERWLLCIGADLVASLNDHGGTYGPGDVVVVGSSADLSLLLGVELHDDAPYSLAILSAGELARRFRAYGTGHVCTDSARCTSRQWCEEIAAGVEARAADLQIGLVTPERAFFTTATALAAELDHATTLAMGLCAQGGDA